MLWHQNNDEDDEEEDLMYSPALMARRASESWIDTPPVEVELLVVAGDLRDELAATKRKLGTPTVSKFSFCCRGSLSKEEG